MSDAYEVAVEALTAHAGRLDQIADDLRVAVDGATSTTLSTDAYGIICQFFPPLVQPIEEHGTTALTTAATETTDLATRVRDAARSYQDTDREHAAAFDQELRR